MKLFMTCTRLIGVGLVVVVVVDIVDINLVSICCSSC